ncbi:MAG: hypothetical protein ACOYJG_05575 [Prevotella sp.]|jgi:hypothetical protein
MKAKFLLTIGLLATVNAGFAQGNAKMMQKQCTNFSMVPAKALTKADAPAVRKSYDDGVYYLTPKGAMFRGWTYDGMGYSYSFLVVPPFTDMTYENACTNASSAAWSVNGNDVDDANLVDGNYVASYSPLGFFYQPTIAVGSTSYSWGDFNTTGSLVATDTLADLGYFDVHAGTRFGWGSLNSDENRNCFQYGMYLYGTGAYRTSDGSDINTSYIVQYFDAPASPLYANDVHALVVSSTKAFNNDNAQLTMTIYPANLTDTTFDSDNPIVTLTCTPSDTAFVYSNFSSSVKDLTVTGGFNMYGLSFTQKVEDPVLGIEVAQPFVIDQPFAIVIEGCNNDGVDVGFFGHGFSTRDADYNDNPDEERQQLPAMQYFEGSDNPVYYSSTALEVFFNGLMDYVSVDKDFVSQNGTITDANVLRVSADGQTVSTEGKSSSENLGAAIAWTAFPWLDSDGAENYSYEVPDWMTLNVDDQYWYQEYQGNTYSVGELVITPVCEALPSGTTGRAATIWLEGKGFKSPNPIIVLQGDATLADGIAAVENDIKNGKGNNGTYNLAGQRVNNATKGIVIKNGRKYLNK